MTGRPFADASRLLRQSAPYQAVAGSLGRVSRLPPPAAAWVVGLLAEDLERDLLVVVPHEADALAWSESAELFGVGGLSFSAPSLSPYQEAEPSLMVRAQEAVTLDRLSRGRHRVVVCTPRALFRRLPNRAAYAGACQTLSKGDPVAIDSLAERLLGQGYERRDLVTEIGEFAVRGGVFDLFPPGHDLPVRLDLFGDSIDSMRSFGPEDQRSREDLGTVRVLPLTLFSSRPRQAIRLAAELARQLGDRLGAETAERLEALESGRGFPGWRNYLPLLAPDAGAIADYCDGPLIVAVEPAVLSTEAAQHADQLLREYEHRSRLRQLAVAPDQIEFSLASVVEQIDGAALSVDEVGPPAADAVDFVATLTDSFQGQLPRFAREVELAARRRERLMIVAPVEQHDRLRRFCDTYDLPRGGEGVGLAAGQLQRGFRLPAAGVVLYGEWQLFAPVVARRPQPRRTPFAPGLRDLSVGDFVVHSDHGIGQFIALRTLAPEDKANSELPPELASRGPASDQAVEVMEIEYSRGRSLLMPLSALDRLQRYGGMEGVRPQLDRLGGSSWIRKKARVKAGMKKLAGDLLRLYAERELARAPAMEADSDLQAQLEAAFEHRETEDQLQAIAAIKEDLMRERPMDRLLCGDVGFGKTEVAIRAALKVVDSGYQVALMAPTTILADQHLETFRRRFADLPVRVEMVSRLRSSAEIRRIREAVEAGQVDILIGTHRLLSRDIQLKRLGLLIVDEEQRFGVAQKERLKELKSEVHVLALSATPVPRTLQLSLAGVRDLSVIETAPRDRRAVETAIAPFSPELIREAIEYELERRGQIYFVYNRVAGIERMASFLRQAIDGLRVTVGHGQMDEAELVRRMHSFKRGDYDLLLATTIIENGIDIPSVNTMIVHRADRFGLAQLYQLRGRVGRSDQLAYCYLLVPPDRVLPPDARRRLAAIREFSELGAGFRVAARDLEIRGAGNLLGAEQSGHIAAVGMETYLKMLQDTVRELRGETVEEVPATTIHLPLPMAIPEDYVSDANLRLEVYRKIAAAQMEPPVLLAELNDRFGAPPPEVSRLLEVASLKRLAEGLRVQSIAARASSVRIQLRRDTTIDVDRLIRLVSEQEGVTFSQSGVLTLSGLAPQDFVAATRQVLQHLA